MPYSFKEVLPSTHFWNITITDEYAVPLTDNSTHERIRQNISLESPMESKKNLVQFMQESCKIYKRIENTSKRILKRIFKRM